MERKNPKHTGAPCVIGVTGDDDRYAVTRRAAMELAREKGAELILYDWDSAGILGDPLPSIWSADGTDTDIPDRLDEAALEAAGRHSIARQVEEAKASGLPASAWLPSEKGTDALLKFGQDHGAIAIVVPSDIGDLGDDTTIEVVKA